MENQITTTSPISAMMLAIEKGANLEQLEKAMQLQERWEARQAQKSYTQAMAAFKADPPKIEKLKQVKFQTSKGMTHYSHATLADVTEKINNALSSHGLHASWKTDQKEKSITVTCQITHIDGHTESTSLSAPMDESGSKNPIQAIGSTVTYLCRYTLLSLTGLATYDIEDHDGQTQTDKITTDQQTEINDMLKDIYGDNSAKWLVYMKVDSVDKIEAKNYGMAISSLKKAKANKEAKS